MLGVFKRTPNVVKSIRNVKFPEKFKGTIVEKWANYWKNLYLDYRQMVTDLRSDIQDEPKKAMLYITGLATVGALIKNNPSEIDFKTQLKNVSNEIILVSEDCQRSKSVDHIRYLDRCFNEGVIHYKSLGVASIMYVSELSNGCDLYKAQCTYLQPRYLGFPSRIVDIGFMGRWWNIFIKTNNYDIKEDK